MDLLPLGLGLVGLANVYFWDKWLYQFQERDLARSEAIGGMTGKERSAIQLRDDETLVLARAGPTAAQKALGQTEQPRPDTGGTTIQERENGGVRTDSDRFGCALSGCYSHPLGPYKSRGECQQNCRALSGEVDSNMTIQV